jgi:hypothetical protein
MPRPTILFLLGAVLGCQSPSVESVTLGVTGTL